MKPKHYPPAFKESKFHCPHPGCGVYAAQSWVQLHTRPMSALPVRMQSAKKWPMWLCFCGHCKNSSYWHEFADQQGRMVVPAESTAEPPHADLPDACKDDYEEARAVFALSPRAAAALLRLAVQKLMGALGQSGTDLNNDIGALVKAGLPSEVQKMMDYCRVVGNHSVHPGQLDVNDTPDIAGKLFKFINLIVEDRITRPKEIDDAFGLLPEGTREAIVKRDKKE